MHAVIPVFASLAKENKNGKLNMVFGSHQILF